MLLFEIVYNTLPIFTDVHLSISIVDIPSSKRASILLQLKYVDH